jgi:hypothetical protein
VRTAKGYRGSVFGNGVVAFTGEGNWFERQLGTTSKELKPRYHASGSQTEQAELPAGIGASVTPQISPTRHNFRVAPRFSPHSGLEVLLCMKSYSPF